jgi:nitroreductase
MVYLTMDLLSLIKQRQSVRTPFNPDKAIARKDLWQILEAGNWAPTAHNMQNFEMVVVEEKSMLERIQRIEIPVSETFIQENYLQLSFCEEDLQKKRKGVLSTLFPKSWLHPGLIPEQSYSDDTEHAHMQRHEQLLTCPALIIMLYNPSLWAPASDGDLLGIMSLGCVLENMWLMASSLGIGFQVVSALTNQQSQLKELLHIPTHLNVAVSFRLGYPLVSNGCLRVRREISDFTHYNGFDPKKGDRGI